MKMLTLPDDKLKITNSEMLTEYIHGGNAVLTLVGPAGTAHTYIFKCPRNSTEFPPGVRFVYVLHEDVRFYLGILDQGKFRRTMHSNFTEEAETVKGAKYIVRLASDQQLLDTTLMKLYQSGRCARCGRLLDSDASFVHGFGRKCWNIHQIKREAEASLFIKSRGGRSTSRC